MAVYYNVPGSSGLDDNFGHAHSWLFEPTTKAGSLKSHLAHEPHKNTRSPKWVAPDVARQVQH